MYILYLLSKMYFITRILLKTTKIIFMKNSLNAECLIVVVIHTA